MFSSQYHVLWCLVCCWGWFCLSALVDSTVWLPCLLGLFVLILVHVHTSVTCPTLPLFPCICWSVVVHTLYHVSLCTVLLPVLGMLILRVLLSHQIVGKVCICYLLLLLLLLFPACINVIAFCRIKNEKKLASCPKHHVAEIQLKAEENNQEE
jgi:hypothetical protein